MLFNRGFILTYILPLNMPRRWGPGNLTLSLTVLDSPLLLSCRELRTRTGQIDSSFSIPPSGYSQAVGCTALNSAQRPWEAAQHLGRLAAEGAVQPPRFQFALEANTCLSEVSMTLKPFPPLPNGKGPSSKLSRRLMVSAGSSLQSHAALCCDWCSYSPSFA